MDEWHKRSQKGKRVVPSLTLLMSRFTESHQSVILGTSLRLLRPPRVATHPLFPEQSSNKTKTTLDPLRTKGVKTLTSVHRTNRTNTNISGWSSVRPGKTLHRVRQGLRPGDLYKVRPMTSEAGKPTRTRNAGNLILFLDRKRLVVQHKKIFCSHSASFQEVYNISKCYYNDAGDTPTGQRQN